MEGLLNESIKIGDKGYPPLTEERANRLLEGYYEERGWNIKDGRLTREKLLELGLGDVVSDLGLK